MMKCQLLVLLLIIIDYGYTARLKPTCAWWCWPETFFLGIRCRLRPPACDATTLDSTSICLCPRQKHAARLQRVQQALARVVMQQPSISPLTSTELLKQLHWLPNEWQIRFKLSCSVHKILHTGHPPYISELLQYHKPARSTRSSASHSLSVPRYNLSFGARAFCVAAPKIWNSIPLHIRQSQTYSSFRRHLKTHYFLSAHLAP